VCQCVWIYKEIYWVIYCYIILIYLLTWKIKLSESRVWFQCFSKWFSSFWINPIPCWTMCQCVCVNIYKRCLSDILLYYIDLFTHLQDQVEWELCLISMLQQVIQLLLNQFDSLLNNVCVNVCEYIKRYIEWYIVILYWYIYSPPRSSWVRVVFDFNASASDSTPFETIWLTVEWCVSVCVWIYKEIYWVIYIYMVLIYLLTSKIKLSESRIVAFETFTNVNKFAVLLIHKPKSVVLTTKSSQTCGSLLKTQNKLKFLEFWNRSRSF
jgi:hypothetical protein